MTLLLTAAAAGLAYFGHNTTVAAVTALAGAVVSWAEFTDIERKLQRYSTVVRSIKKLISWWDSLGQSAFSVSVGFLRTHFLRVLVGRP